VALRWTWIVLLAASSARAQAPGLAERLVVPEGECLGQEALTEHLEGWLGGDLPAGDHRKIVVDLGADERTGVTFVILDEGRALGERRFERLPESCADRRAALSLAIAIALDAGVLDRLGVPRLAEPELPPPPPSPDPEPPSEPAPELPAPLRFEVASRVGFGAGVLPSWQASLELTVGIRRARWSTHLGLWATAASRTALGEGAIRARAVAGSLSFCGHARPVRRLGMAGCAGVLVGGWMATGSGFAQSLSDTVASVNGQAQLLARWPEGSPVAVEIGARVLVSVVRARFSVVDASGAPIERTSQAPVGGEGTIGLIVDFQ